MKQNIFFLLGLPVIILLMAGCSSTRTYQKVNHIIYPAKRLPEQASKVKVMHTVPLKENRNTSDYRVGQQPQDIRTADAHQFGQKGKPGYMIDQVVRELKQGRYYQTEKMELGSNDDILSWNTSKLHDYLQSDQEVLLVLENLNSDYDFKSEKIRKHQLDQNGEDYYIDAWEANRYYKVLADWKVYHGTPAKLLYHIRSQGEKRVATQGLQKDQTISKLDSIARGTERFLLDSLAGELAGEIIPKKVFDSWTYYVKGSDALEEGYKYMKLDKLEEAQKIYQKGLKVPSDPKVKARLHYNLSIIHDIWGLPDQALMHAEKAVLSDDKYLHQSLYDELKLKKEIAERS